MEKFTVKILVLAAAMIAPNLVARASEVMPIRYVDQISNEELSKTARAVNMYATVDLQHDESDAAKTD